MKPRSVVIEKPRASRSGLPGLFVILVVAMLVGLFPWPVKAADCPQGRVRLQVLGSGGPELNDGRASSGYLVWVDDKAVVLVDAGPGTSVAFGESGARFEDLQAILLTHLHVDHSADLPAYIKGSFFTRRSEDLPVLGRQGMP